MPFAKIENIKKNQFLRVYYIYRYLNFLFSSSIRKIYIYLFILKYILIGFQFQLDDFIFFSLNFTSILCKLKQNKKLTIHGLIMIYEAMMLIWFE